MKLSACVACKLPVIELEGQFDLLDSFFIKDGVPPEETSGEWHLSCLRSSGVGGAWHEARLRNYVDVRGFTKVQELAKWTVIRDPRRGKMLAIGKSGELVDLSIGPRKLARESSSGLVFPRVDEEFHLELEDAAAAQAMKDSLTSTTVYPVSALFASLGIADKVADADALEGAVFKFDKGLSQLWTKFGVSARLEYGVFIPGELIAHIGERVR